MPGNSPIPHTLDDVIAEIASILAQGYLRYRKSQYVPPESDDEAKKAKYSQVFTENRLDSSAPRSLHS